MDTHTVAYPDSGAPAMDEEEECADTPWTRMRLKNVTMLSGRNQSQRPNAKYSGVPFNKLSRTGNPKPGNQLAVA